jgi:DNA repair ATPase RecN
MNINSLKNKLAIFKGKLLQLEETKVNLELELKEQTEKLKLLEEAQLFLQSVAQQTQEKLKYQIEDIVNLALETCFPDEFKFELQIDIARGKTEAKLVFISQKTGGEIDPMNASGGGVLDVVCFALRLACYTLETNSNNVIVFDEPFRFLSADLRESACEIISKLSNQLNIQIIMVTHISEFVGIADKVFVVSKDTNGKSKVIVKKGD